MMEWVPRGLSNIHTPIPVPPISGKTHLHDKVVLLRKSKIIAQA
jgi:hypothetical protein